MTRVNGVERTMVVAGLAARFMMANDAVDVACTFGITQSIELAEALLVAVEDRPDEGC